MSSGKRIFLLMRILDGKWEITRNVAHEFANDVAHKTAHEIEIVQSWIGGKTLP